MITFGEVGVKWYVYGLGKVTCKLFLFQPPKNFSNVEKIA
jgi:hypothetical protein